jgi:hypothetical protein
MRVTSLAEETRSLEKELQKAKSAYHDHAVSLMETPVSIIKRAGPGGVVLDGVAFLGQKHYKDRTMEGVLDCLRREEGERMNQMSMMMLEEGEKAGNNVNNVHNNVNHHTSGQQNVLVNNFVGTSSSNHTAQHHTSHGVATKTDHHDHRHDVHISAAVLMDVQRLAHHHHHDTRHHLKQNKLRSAAGERLLATNEEKAGMRKDNNSVQVYIDALEEQVGVVWEKVEEMRSRHRDEFEWEMLKAFKNGKRESAESVNIGSVNSGGLGGGGSPSGFGGGKFHGNSEVDNHNLNLHSESSRNINDSASTALIPASDRVGRPSLMFLLHSIVAQVQAFQKEVDYCFEHIKLLEDWRLKYEFTMMQKAHGVDNLLQGTKARLGTGKAFQFMARRAVGFQMKTQKVF